MKRILLSIFTLLSFGFFMKSTAQIVLLNSFDPADAGSICGIGYHIDSSQVWIYGCSSNSLQCYDISGNLLNSFTQPGGSANDVDVEIAPSNINFNETIIPQGQLLFVNGENGNAEIYAIDNSTGTVIDTLATKFGASHVVGGSYHPTRNTFFLVQDNVPGALLENMIAEINPTTGDTLHTFQITDYFTVSYGDIEVGGNGNLFVVSNIETEIAEFSPDGEFIQTHALPEGVSGLSGIALDCNAGEAWVSNTDGLVFHLGQFPCGSLSGVKDIPAQTFSLSEIRPNSFVDGFSFSIEMKQSGYVKLALVNMLGQEVKLINDGFIEAGKYDFSISDKSITKGIYTLLVDSGVYKVSKRIVCIK